LGFRIFWIKIRSLPGEERLWRAIYEKDQLRNDGTPRPAFFRDKNGVSCDLSRFSTQEKSRFGHKIPPRWGKGAGLVEFCVKDASEAGSNVEHHPVKTQEVLNYAHCQLATHLSTKQADQLRKQAKIVIEPSFD